jgi:siroheme synthase-like protein
VCLDLDGRTCVVIGGGAVAGRKVRALLSCGARVRVVSPALGAGLARLAVRGRIAWHRELYRPGAMAGAALVIAATDDRGLNAVAARDAACRGIPVNAVDAPADGTFIVPAVLSRGPVTVSVSTGGASPFLARRIRERLAQTLGPEYGAYARLFARARRLIRQRYPADRRAALYRKIDGSPALALLKAGRRRQAAALVRRIVGEADNAG